MNPFPTCKITVLKTLYRPEPAEQYRREDVHQGPCPFFKEATSSLQASGGAVLINSNGTMRVASATEDWREDLELLCLELGRRGSQVGALYQGSRTDWTPYSEVEKSTLTSLTGSLGSVPGLVRAI
jgi:hypothetical protein